MPIAKSYLFAVCSVGRSRDVQRIVESRKAKPLRKPGMARRESGRFGRALRQAGSRPPGGLFLWILRIALGDDHDLHVLGETDDLLHQIA